MYSTKQVLAPIWFPAFPEAITLVKRHFVLDEARLRRRSISRDSDAGVW